MADSKIQIKDAQILFPQLEVTGTSVEINGEAYFKIQNVDQMPPFFISLVSHSDHWMFIGSNGALSAGRKDEENALFPYYTDDKIIASSDQVGSKTLVLLLENGKKILWQPFSDSYNGLYNVTRNLYKNQWGNELLFEEINGDLGLSFLYSWSFSSKFGFIRKSIIVNNGKKPVQVELLDGVQNILPYGVSSQLQLQRSNLVNAYKRNELDKDSGLGIFALSAMIVDRAEPSEALKATIGWHIGIETTHVLLSSRQLESFCRGHQIHTETDVKGEAGSYMIHVNLDLNPDEAKNWYCCFEINQSQPAIHNLTKRLEINKKEVFHDIEDDLQKGTAQLKTIVAKADGLQLTADKLSTSRHYANVLFNVMRGGIFEQDYGIDKKDFLNYLQEVNQPLSESLSSFLNSLPEILDYSTLKVSAVKQGNSDLIRICAEYLPLSFSRRHGDPSRPWNKFSIDLTNDDGSARRAYAGNWRDIFQNWEALAVSYPKFIEGMIFKFLNASTLDGYNPYRISRSGVDWEVIEHDDPWSYIGYWGDHQLIYLLKLLEVARSHESLSLSDLSNKPWFVYADVPYRIKSYDQIVADSQDTIDFDAALDSEAQKRFKNIGADGKLVYDQKGQLLKSGFVEKILVSWLTKLCNLIPDAGIWMNTQRPEWNDANNALVGNGTSMVTLYYMHRFTQFLSDWAKDEDLNEIVLHREIADLIKNCQAILVSNRGILKSGFDDKSRRSFVDEFGNLAEEYRSNAYAGFSGDLVSIDGQTLQNLFGETMLYLQASTKNNKREDGLYHAYNLVSFTQDGLEVDYLYEMLEGQVSVLSSGFLGAKESLDLLNAMKSSKLYREDQYSYMLYPNRDLSGFLQKNHLSQSDLNSNAFLTEMLQKSDFRIVEKDSENNAYFNGDLNNGSALKAVLEEVQKDYMVFNETDFQQIEAIYEKVFNHKAFTGRSGTFFAFEGLGSIYWHMVSKLLLAVQEILSNEEEIEESVRGSLVDHYYEIRAGIGINKSPGLYGAFPTDPYSHTPFHRGAQQPGMTGQVKEDILSRWAELGVKVKDGMIHFQPTFLNENEWLKKPDTFNYISLQGKEESLELKAGELAFTYCQVPIKYFRSESKEIKVYFSGDRGLELIKGFTLSKELSASIFSRSQEVRLVEVRLGGI
ncbi:hypothetical protein [Aquiflexum lacus]|uniref:hypothetical protein n=1 Tax=Aquiflexum lacus TaxID=2483805 RepID=UPI001E630E9C|nr:hypothetical protein [Aquiflexum lacus]